MPRGRKPNNVTKSHDERIEAIDAELSKLAIRIDELKNERKLVEKEKQNDEAKELYSALMKSGKSFNEVLQMIQAS